MKDEGQQRCSGDSAERSAQHRNAASDSGGAIDNLNCTVTLQQCNLSANTAGSDGGGIYSGAGGTLSLKDSSVLNDLALLGGDIYNLGVLNLDDAIVGILGP